jgi:hypothetical protein
VKLLLDSEADVKLPDENGSTPLHAVAGEQDCLEMVELLLRYGADINARNCQDATPLHLAIRNSEAPVEMVKFLLAHGAGANLKNDTAATPLHIAARFAENGPAIIKLLLDHGAEIDAEDTNEVTALDSAVFHECRESAQLLLASGARPTSEDRAEHYREFSFNDLMDEARQKYQQQEPYEINSRINLEKLTTLSDLIARDGLSRDTADRVTALAQKLTILPGSVQQENLWRIAQTAEEERTRSDSEQGAADGPSSSNVVASSNETLL